MNTSQRETVVGVFANHDQAQRATHALKDAGFTEQQIGVASSHQGHGTGADADGDDSYAGEGAMAGVATGAGIGALWGLGILAGVLPGIGTAIAGGTLGILLSSAAAGAAAAGLAGALIGMGLTKEEAEYYEGEMKSGKTIVTVKAAQRHDEALRIIHQFGGYDMNSRHMTGTTTQSSAYLNPARQSGHQSAASQQHMSPTASARNTNQGSTAAGSMAHGQTLQAHEEKLQVHKTPVETGEVRVHKEVHTEHKSIDVPVTREEVVIERRPASGQQVSASDMSAGQEIRIPVREEQVNVEKQTVVAEEVSIGKRQVRDTEHVDETLRKEEIKVDSKGNANVKNRDQSR
jgi:uncharacterized protein (TIGR02271 family)